MVVGFLGAVGTSIWTQIQDLAPDADPLVARVEFPLDDCAQVVVSTDELSELPSSRDDFTLDWALARGAGEETNGQVLVVTVQGMSKEAVVLHGWEVVDLTVAALPADPVIVTKCPPTGGPLETRYFDVKLSEDPPAVLSLSDSEEEEPIDFPYVVSSEDPEHFIVMVDGTQAGVYQWSLGVRWSSGGREGVMVLSRSGEPLRTAVAPGAHMRVWEEDGSWSGY